LARFVNRKSYAITRRPNSLDRTESATSQSSALSTEASIYQTCSVAVTLIPSRTELAAPIEFTKWTPDGHLRRSKFVGLRKDKEAGGVVRESVLTRWSSRGSKSTDSETPNRIGYWDEARIGM